ncbi:hypothetical protein T459_27588 [Capsicum annuum]|uniref:Uncharacterized protein n=1 Tax=Capsicum annuum TaxID=4072 RepID=A0A2G2YEV6_CAPAN|nr:hypothetical protein T459_27588 [Capsicum annuum]
MRWFLGYPCCDACGRLFVKGNYCLVCLKVYRDSKSTHIVGYFSKKKHSEESYNLADTST